MTVDLSADDVATAGPTAGGAGESGTSPWAVYTTILLCLTVAGLLSSARLVEVAERLPFGPRRDLVLGIAQGIHGEAQALGWDRPARIVDEVLGRTDGIAGGGVPASAGGSAEPSVPFVAATPLSGEVTSLVPGDPITVFIPGGPRAFLTPGSFPAAPTAPRRKVSPDRPLRVLVVGDSFAHPLGFELTNFGTRDAMVEVAIDARISTGMTRPDYFDWPAQLAGVAASAPPEALVIFMGANDDQNMVIDDGSVVMLTTPEWQAEYRRRVDLILDTFANRGVVIYWVGLPIMRDPFEAQVAEDVNAVLSEEAAKRPWVRYVDIWSMFSDAAGQYATYLPDAAGEMRLVRQGDGVHLTRGATNEVAGMVYDALHRDWHLTPPTPTATATATSIPTDTATSIPTDTTTAAPTLGPIVSPRPPPP